MAFARKDHLKQHMDTHGIHTVVPDSMEETYATNSQRTFTSPLSPRKRRHRYAIREDSNEVDRASSMVDVREMDYEILRAEMSELRKTVNKKIDSMLETLRPL